jgi:hypothetical protein
MRRLGFGATAAFVVAGLGMAAGAKPPKPPTTTAATLTVRCFSAIDGTTPDPCADPSGPFTEPIDRVRDDTGGAYSGSIASVGMFLTHFAPAAPAPRSLNIFLGPSLSTPDCSLSANNCNADGPLSEVSEVEADIRVKPLTATFDDLPGGLFGMTCGPTEVPALVHYTFWLGTGNGHWGLNFNPRAYPLSTEATLVRETSDTWTVQAGLGHRAELISFADSRIRGKTGPSREGVYVVPFKLTITATSGTQVCP